MQLMVSSPVETRWGGSLYHLHKDQWESGGWMVRDLERSQFFQLVRKTSGKEVCVDGSLQMGKGFGDSGVSCKCSKGDFNGEAQQPSR